MPSIKIITAHLELIPATGELLRADMEAKQSLAEKLDAEVSEKHWPPEQWKDALEEFLVRTERYPDITGWLSWYWVLNDPGQRSLIGCGGFTGASFNGQVEIGYSVLEPFQRRGYGAEAVSALVNWAFAHNFIQNIYAVTFPENTASVRLLEKCGFEYAGKGLEKGTIRFLLPRDKWMLIKN